MKFIIHRPYQFDYADLINKYPILSEYGIKPYSEHTEWGEIEVSTLDDLIKLMNQLKHDLVIGDYFLDKKVKTPLITIYDDYLE